MTSEKQKAAMKASRVSCCKEERPCFWVGQAFLAGWDERDKLGDKNGYARAKKEFEAKLKQAMHYHKLKDELLADRDKLIAGLERDRDAPTRRAAHHPVKFSNVGEKRTPAKKEVKRK